MWNVQSFKYLASSQISITPPTTSTHLTRRGPNSVIWVSFALFITNTSLANRRSFRTRKPHMTPSEGYRNLEISPKNIRELLTRF
mmetsp:Transcript_4613/g.17423  ORF Transcript_4613/g.17423 Transcript_4613/m.17423 type:complete len:85 (+) Transcript_4613:1935-2189(+)